MSAQLQVEAMYAGYGRLPVLRAIDLEVRQGEVVALVGRNGAGKSTLLRTIAGSIRPTAGRVSLDGVDVTRWAPERRVRAGLSHVAEGRRIFGEQSVRANLELGIRFQALGRRERDARLDEALALFPALRERFDIRASKLSGGQQQMLAIAVALMRRPAILMLDEPSLGLAPLLVEQVFSAIQQLREQHRTILLVEQMVERALDFADRVFVLQAGEVVAVGSPADLRHSGEIHRAYLAAAPGRPRP